MISWRTDMLRSIGRWTMFGMLLLFTCLICGCTSEDLIMINSYSNSTSVINITGNLTVPSLQVTSLTNLSGLYICTNVSNNFSLLTRNYTEAQLECNI